MFHLDVGIKLLYSILVKCEYTFSIMKLKKIQQRNRMKEETFDNIIGIKFIKSEDVINCINNIVYDKIKQNKNIIE